MLTPHLEKLILSGKAAYKTFVIGGTQKHIMNVQKNRYIIITDLTYFPNLNAGNMDHTNYLPNSEFDKLKAALNTQLKVFSMKSNNSFVFRNSFTAVPHFQGNAQVGTYVYLNGQQVKLDVYLVHETDVSFTFSTFGENANIFNAISKADTIAYPPPFDYGQEGQTGAVATKQVGQFALTTSGTNFAGSIASNAPLNLENNLEFIGPVDNNHIPPDLDHAQNYPLILVGYVEIKGNLTNIEQTS